MIALARAGNIWQSGIQDPPYTSDHPEAGRWKDVITSLITSGLGWKNWDCHNRRSPTYGKRVSTYCGDHCMSWCGAFVAYCWFELDKYVRRGLASTYKISLLLADEPRRRVPPAEVQPGDIACVRGRGTHAWGDHIVLVRDVINDSFTTYEGNAKGRGPTGEIYQGVVTNLRKISEIVQVLRPIDEDHPLTS